MRARTLVLFAIALILAGGTALLVRSWLAQRAATVAAAPPPPPPAPSKSVLVARAAIARGQLLKPADLAWQPWPEAEANKAYILSGTKKIEDFAGWVARAPLVAGEPVIEAKIVSPGDRGFLAAVLAPGMRAVSVPVTATSGISGFVFPGDRVDVLITHPLPAKGPGGDIQHKAAETVLHDVRVIAIDQKLDGKPGDAMIAHNATFEVTPKQSEIVALATEIGKLSLSLRPLAGSASDQGEVEAADGMVGAGTFTLDSEVSRLLPKLSSQNHSDDTVTVLRGNGKAATVIESQSASRGP
jgi:pilus assembly protein CpaB